MEKAENKRTDKEKTEKFIDRSDDFDIDIQACSTMDCTGLIPALPESEAEREAYEDLYPYITHAKNVKED